MSTCPHCQSPLSPRDLITALQAALDRAADPVPYEQARATLAVLTREQLVSMRAAVSARLRRTHGAGSGRKRKGEAK